MNPNCLFLSADAVRRALSVREAIEAMRDAFTQLQRCEVTQPARLRLDARDDNGTALVMQCHSALQKYFSLKFITLFNNNPQHGLPLLQSTVLLADGSTGTMLAIMDGASLTALRTGGATGLATELLARPDAATAAIFGCGVQARTQLEAIACVRHLRRVRVYDPDAESAKRFSDEMQDQLGIAIEQAASASAAVADADIVCTVTTSATPVFDDRDIRPGTHINAIGVFRPEMAEVPAATVHRARVVVDHFVSAREEAGDLLIPFHAGLISQEHFSTELGEVLLGVKSGRTCAGEITLFKSVGVAIQDLCAASRALANARQRGLGTPLH